MIPELGHLALILSFCLALVLGTVPLIGSYRSRPDWQALARPLAAGQFVFVLLAFLILAQAFVANDFSVAYVAHNSSTQLPLLYRISAVWGAHEGSLLLWALILSGWTLAVAAWPGPLPPRMLARVLSVMGLVSVGFQLFVLLTSNPFSRLLPWPPSEGAELNPLLQDIGLVLHPPILYMGYVGCSVVFALAIAALLEGKVDAAWARWSRPWTLVAWLFLTVGIALGSWWAYYELGWGGWWFWDPVENASFMPWLLATALLHALAVTARKGALTGWTLLLAIGTFSLSLLGTFLVRSGVLTSVHAFASDPARGLFILLFLMVVVGSSLLLFALRVPAVSRSWNVSWLSKDMLLLANTALLAVACSTVLLGTLYPLIIDALGLGKISVGPPFFNTFMVPLTLLAAALLGLGLAARWQQGRLDQLRRPLLWTAGASFAAGLLASFASSPVFELRAALVLTLVFWVLLMSAMTLVRQCRQQGDSLLAGLRALSGRVWGMHLAHCGLAVVMVGVLMVSLHSTGKDLRMAPGDHVQLEGYSFRFDGVQQRTGPNYISRYGTLRVTRPGSGSPQALALMHPEKRLYNASRSVLTEAAIVPGLLRDLYVALGEDLGEGAWAVRIQIKAFVRWIWAGALLMALGGLLCVVSRCRQMTTAGAGQSLQPAEHRAPGPAGMAAARVARLDEV